MDCLFCKIVAGKFPRASSTKTRKLSRFTISARRRRCTSGHPERHIPTLEHLTEADRPLAGHILFTAQRLAREQGCEEGFRVVMNCNDLGGQTVHHIHMHVLGQRQMHWPPG